MLLFIYLFIYLRYMQNILFTVIWRQTYSKGPLRERGNPLPSLHELLFINSKVSFICIIPHLFTSRGALAGMKNNSMGQL